MRWVRLLPLALLFTSLLSGCSSRATAHPGVLRLPLYPGEVVADPARAVSLSQIFLVSLLYSGLVRFGPDLHVIPDLAVSIPTVSGDGSAYTFTVRHDARFADGSRCRASDIAYSLARALSPSVHSAEARRYLGEISGASAVEQGRASSLSGVEILNPLTVRIRLTHPDANFLQKLAFPSSFVVERHALRHGRATLTRPAGTGPWVVEKRGRDGSLVLVPRRHDYTGPLPLHSLSLVPVAGTAQALDQYRRGAVDAAYIPPDAYRAWSTRADFHSTAGLTAYYALPSPHAGGVLTHLDRPRLVQGFSGFLTPLASIVPPAVPDYVPSTAASAASPDARSATVREAPPGDPIVRRLGAALSDQLDAGARDKQGVITIIHRTYLLPVPSAWISTVLPETSSSWFRYKLSRTYSLSNDPVSRMDIYAVLEQWALNHHLLIPLASTTISYAIKPSVSNLEVTGLGLMPANGTWNTVQVG